MMETYGAGALAVAALGMFLGGLTKGAVGFALPMVAIGVMGTVLTVETAVAFLIMPGLISNIWQILRTGVGAALATVRQFWLLNLCLGTALFLAAKLIVVIDDAVLFVILGSVVGVLALIQLLGWRPPAPTGSRPAWQAGVGGFAGLLGGLTGLWGPPVLMYLIACQTPKAEQVRALGLVFLFGSAVLVVAHLRTGVLNEASLPASLLCVLPALAGMALGLLLQDRLDQAKFRKLTLVVLCIVGLNLLRRGITGL
jgi:uncharacterized membrane protein YfcA